jgi:regulator of replication initiation timing
MFDEFTQAIVAIHKANDALEYGIQQSKAIREENQRLINENSELRKEISNLKSILETYKSESKSPN